MGYGQYSHLAHTELLRTRSDTTVQAVFRQDRCHALMDPKGVAARESRDSPDHPRTLPVAFALDVTGSMGEIPRLLATEELPNFMKVLEATGQQDAQVLFLAVGDASSDRSPLQVGQFESTAELMDQWLTYCHIELGGGGGDQESYELALYFLAEHTEFDHHRKRGRKGYVFITGDERPYPYVSRLQVEAFLGDALDADIPVADCVAALAERFHPFFLIPDLDRRRRCERAWRDLLGDAVICMESPRDTCYVAAGALALTEGLVSDVDALARAIEASGASRERIGAAVRALSPYAALLGRDGPGPRLEGGYTLRSGRPSRLEKLPPSE